MASLSAGPLLDYAWRAIHDERQSGEKSMENKGRAIGERRQGDVRDTAAAPGL
jgi:hypothetical protein